MVRTFAESLPAFTPQRDTLPTAPHPDTCFYFKQVCKNTIFNDMKKE
jgi:hypothetical protein